MYSNIVLKCTTHNHVRIGYRRSHEMKNHVTVQMDVRSKSMFNKVLNYQDPFRLILNADALQRFNVLPDSNMSGAQDVSKKGFDKTTSNSVKLNTSIKRIFILDRTLKGRVKDWMGFKIIKLYPNGQKTAHDCENWNYKIFDQGLFLYELVSSWMFGVSDRILKSKIKSLYLLLLIQLTPWHTHHPDLNRETSQWYKPM